MLITNVNIREKIPAFLNEMKYKVGVELGVATGSFSDWILRNSNLEVLYSVDQWTGDRGHDIHQYFSVVTLFRHYGKRSIILRAPFSEAVKIFNDEFFDFIYIDGYAHNAQEDGRTLYEWFPKLKVGGLFSGHDYVSHIDSYKRNAKIVDEFMKMHNLNLHITKDDILPSWMTLK